MRRRGCLLALMKEARLPPCLDGGASACTTAPPAPTSWHYYGAVLRTRTVHRRRYHHAAAGRGREAPHHTASRRPKASFTGTSEASPTQGPRMSRTGLRALTDINHRDSTPVHPLVGTNQCLKSWISEGLPEVCHVLIRGDGSGITSSGDSGIFILDPPMVRNGYFHSGKPIKPLAEKTRIPKGLARITRNYQEFKELAGLSRNPRFAAHWCTMAFIPNVSSQKCTELRGIARNYREFHRILTSVLGRFLVRTLMKSASPLGSMEFNGIHWNSMDFTGIPRFRQFGHFP